MVQPYIIGVSFIKLIDSYDRHRHYNITLWSISLWIQDGFIAPEMKQTPVCKGGREKPYLMKHIDV